MVLKPQQRLSPVSPGGTFEEICAFRGLKNTQKCLKQQKITLFDKRTPIFCSNHESVWRIELAMTWAFKQEGIQNPIGGGKWDEVYRVYNKVVKIPHFLYFRQHSRIFGIFPKIYFNQKNYRPSSSSFVQYLIFRLNDKLEHDKFSSKVFVQKIIFLVFLVKAKCIWTQVVLFWGFRQCETSKFNQKQRVHFKRGSCPGGRLQRTFCSTRPMRPNCLN